MDRGRSRRCHLLRTGLSADGDTGAAAADRGAISGTAVDNSGIIPVGQAYFAFEVEGPVGTLDEVPIWDELEPMPDNPYLFALAPDVEGDFQGCPSYRSAVPRRRSFVYRNGAGEAAGGGMRGDRGGEYPLFSAVLNNPTVGRCRRTPCPDRVSARIAAFMSCPGAARCRRNRVRRGGCGL